MSQCMGFQYLLHQQEVRPHTRLLPRATAAQKTQCMDVDEGSSPNFRPLALLDMSAWVII